MLVDKSYDVRVIFCCVNMRLDCHTTHSTSQLNQNVQDRDK